MTRRTEQLIYLSISAITVLLGFLLTRYYRPYIYSNQLNDLGFADTIGSLVSVVAFCFLIWGLFEYSDKQKNLHIIMITILYGIFWEILGLLGIHGTFDWKDIVAAFISGGLTYLIKNALQKPSAKTES